MSDEITITDESGESQTADDLADALDEEESE
ncbi:MAG: hypothetical protein UY40_C0004G0002 [candidate division CPR1 bacterium GW2011_GWC1_49_13]|uniref:Uncharacterized protein n=1 Tax=candidate division CPR1 bacterium GW2011_GWC1_49_13 TaxID=1618342 RepID=A0A0G1VHK0_9BACT|nr:MAG: hypothetical protein UY40_C0004G0002 [candidate division CPR1 bacterium GW2011_GWC1_49_13]